MRPNSLRAHSTPFKQTAASQSMKLLHSAVQQPAPRACRRRRGHKGRNRIRVRDSFGVELIAVSQRTVLTSSQFRHNSDGPPDPTRLAAPAARGSACGQRCRRTALLRALICRRLSERSGVAAQRVGRHRRLNCVTQVCPERSAGTQTIGSPFLWVLIFWRSKRKYLG